MNSWVERTELYMWFTRSSTYFPVKGRTQFMKLRMKYKSVIAFYDTCECLYFYIWTNMLQTDLKQLYSCALYWVFCHNSVHISIRQFTTKRGEDGILERGELALGSFTASPTYFPKKGRANFDNLGRRWRLEQQMKSAAQISW